MNPSKASAMFSAMGRVNDTPKGSKGFFTGGKALRCILVLFAHSENEVVALECATGRVSKATPDGALRLVKLYEHFIQ